VPIALPPLVPGIYLRRDNRFRVQVQVNRRVEAAHLPNSGRLDELLVRGHKMWLAPADLRRSPQRRTAFDVVLVEFAGRLVSMDARLPGHLVADALEHRRLKVFEDYRVFQREVRLGQSRLDFRLDGEPEIPCCWIEAKSVTLVENGTARFPDAPTLRGQRHVQELIKAVEDGERGVVFFVVQRDDARQFKPHDQADPAFCQTLRQAAQVGVEVLAWRCQVSLKTIELVDEIPVLL
jgi:sugar fermentation stimulation protein A